MLFQVPQFIDTEDRIVGPMSLRQFGYIGGAFGIGFILYFILPLGIWATACSIMLIVAGAFAFVKVNGRPFSLFIMAFVEYYWNSQQYVWQPEHPARNRTEIAAGDERFALEKIVSGLALKNAFRKVQTGSVYNEEEHRRVPSGTERYQIFRAATGEQRAAKRVDYR